MSPDHQRLAEPFVRSWFYRIDTVNHLLLEAQPSQGFRLGSLIDRRPRLGLCEFRWMSRPRRFLPAGSTLHLGEFKAQALESWRDDFNSQPSGTRPHSWAEESLDICRIEGVHYAKVLDDH